MFSGSLCCSILGRRLVDRLDRLPRLFELACLTLFASLVIAEKVAEAAALPVVRKAQAGTKRGQ